MIVIVAEQIESPRNAKPGEGVWRLRLPNPDRWVEVTVQPIGSMKDEPWLAVTADQLHHRRLSSAGATVGHALAAIVESAELWRLGLQPCMATTADPRLSPEDVTIQPPPKETA